MNREIIDVLVVGAGIAGLMAGRTLAEHGRYPILIDKGRSVGGRLATRRIGGGRADHGAQFFTVRSPRFLQHVEAWQADGLVFEWSRGFEEGSLHSPADQGHPRYAVRGGMNALAKHLARDLDIRTEIRIKSIGIEDHRWIARSATGEALAANTLVLTSPAPQSLALLDTGKTKLAGEVRQALESIAYAPCLCGLFHVKGSVNLPAPGALQRPDAPIPWMADNRRKGISPESRIITVHASPDWSHDRWDHPDEAILAELEAELTPRLASDARLVEGQLKRWRFALPTRHYPQPCLVADMPARIVFAGDAFGSPRVEGAALSGLAAAGALTSN